MRILRTLPAVVSLALLGSHFLRSGRTAMVVLCLAFAALALVRRQWAAWLTRLALVAGAGVWAGTLVAIVSRRQAAGEPWARMAAILGIVAFTTLLAAVVLPRGRRSREGVRREGAYDAGRSSDGEPGGAESDSTR